MPWYDQWGWASLTEIPGRYTDVPLPENIPEGHAANWTGYTWVVRQYVAPPPSVAPSRRLTKRSFWNRFPTNNEVAMRGVMIAGSPLILAASLERLKARVEASPFVDLDLQETIDALNWLSSQAVPSTVTLDGVTLPFRLTADEAQAVIGPDPSASERWEG